MTNATSLKGRKALVGWGLAVGLLIGGSSVRGQEGGATPPAPAAEPAEPKKDLPAGKEIIERHLKAVGGREAILSHSSRVLRATMSTPIRPGEMQIEMTSAKPNRFVQRISTPQGEVLAGFDGKVAWVNNVMMGPQILEGEQAEGLIRRSDFYEDAKDPSKYKAIETVDVVDFEGRECYKVRLTRVSGEEESFEFYDVETGLQAGRISQEPGMGSKVEMTMVMQNYKEFGGVKSPTRMIVRAMGIVQIMSVTSIEYDKVEPSAFDLPEEIKALLKEKEAADKPATGETKPAEPKPQP
ncbi:MAG: hypothetical protein FLDDKLPJ_03404 [Phycisphaerae bacterium]|nr:hypothetical protein [Phycisphaerae bacterium]